MENNRPNRCLTTLGLAVRAGRAVFGTQAVCDALRDGTVSLVVEATGNSQNTHKRLCDRCAYYGVRLISCGAGAAELGAAAGRKSPAAAVAVTDKSLASAVAAAADKDAAGAQ